ncbi:MAG: dephospho-CoA kinase [Bacteroidetes bacterium]|nr:dephospho-CoA kinase [Bacteroidota bacterium]
MKDNKSFNKKKPLQEIVDFNDNSLPKAEEPHSLIIGITGGIGTGKTTVSKYLEEKGYYVINADQIAKDLLTNNNIIKEKIIKEFGTNSYVNNQYNTSYISNIVFNNTKKLSRLNQIVHPAVLNQIINLIDTAMQKNIKIIFIDIALLFELNLEEGVDYILTITAKEDIRINRVIKRSNLPIEEIKRRINNQISVEEAVQNSDFVIENNDTIEKLYNSVDYILDIFKTLMP